jgi:hypothetical protein
MNWCTGLLRLWLVATAIWLVSVAWLERDATTDLWDDITNLDFVWLSQWVSHVLPDLAGLLFIPPIATLAVGASLIWAFRGFRKV